MTTIATRPSVSPVPWPYDHEQYGAPDTYERAAEWLRDCASVADWGGAAGHFRTYLPPSVKYTLVDGTLQASDQVLADLTTYTEPSDGILLRHVLDNTHDWRPILTNALQAFRRRMVIVTFIGDGEHTHQIPKANGWPYWQFNPDDLRAALAPHFVRDEAIRTTHAERVYYLERR